MSPISIPKLALKRLAADRLLLAVVFVGITITTTLVAVGPVYVTALERLALNQAIDGMRGSGSNLHVFGYNVPITRAELLSSDQALAQAIDRHIAALYRGRERYLIVDPYIAGLPTMPFSRSRSFGRQAARGSLRTLTGFEDHVTLLKGRMPRPEAESGALGPKLEAVISPATARMFSLELSNVITLAPAVQSTARISVRIVGIVEAADPTGPYWKPNARLFLDPSLTGDTLIDESSPGSSTLEFDPDRPPIPLFTHREAMVEAVEDAFPGTLADSLWFIQLDTERLKEWPLAEAQRRLDQFEIEFTKALPGSEVITGIRGVLSDFERRSFFSRVPLLVLLVVLVATLLFFLFMMVSYRVQSTESDTTLLRSRGAGVSRLLRLYTLESLVMTLLAVALAPFLATGTVALAGKLPYFHLMTGGDLLPAKLSPAPFLLALLAGTLCLAIYSVSGALGARGGALAQKLRSSRPPRIPLFQRYHLDVGLLVLGGLTFWELHSRGRLVTGGLFKEAEVNEALLLAPVLFLLVVALLFMRIFPLLVRFVGAESPAFLHVIASASVLVLAADVAVRELQEGNATAWFGPAALALAVGALYWATSRAALLRLRLAGIAVQAALVAGFLALEPLEPGRLLFVPAIGLILILPGQVAFVMLQSLARISPVWLSVGLWHMARNPLQYTWLVVLLVMVTGAGILSTTVGGTLERSQMDRIEYEVAADIRVTDIDGYMPGGTTALRDGFLDIPGVTSVSLALRDHVLAGPARVELLALESQEFPYLSWYRDDFSDRPLSAIMGALRSHQPAQRIALPEGATTIGAWVRPDEEYPDISMWVVVQDAMGDMTTLSLGELGPPEWHLISTTIPPRLGPLLYLVSVQIFEPGQGPVLTPGKLRIDDIHVTVGPGRAELVLEDFESRIKRWTPIITSALSPDRLTVTASDVHGGARAGLFSFGEDNVDGVRGFYQSPTGGAIPVVFSSSFAQATGVREGDVLFAQIAGMQVPVVARDTIHYFPTLSPRGGGFMLADLDSILGHLNILGHRPSVRPNEVFVAGVPGVGESVREAVPVLTRLSGQVHDRAARLEQARTDPLSTAGWRSMVVLSLGVVVLAASLGYLTYLLSFFGRNKGELGFLKSMGLSRRQMMGLLGFEQLAVAAMGLGLGTFAGFQMSRIMVSSVSVTEKGLPILPPFVLVTDWGLMLPAYLALTVTLVVALLALNRSIERLDLQAIARM